MNDYQKGRQDCIDGTIKSNGMTDEYYEGVAYQYTLDANADHRSEAQCTR